MKQELMKELIESMTNSNGDLRYSSVNYIGANCFKAESTMGKHIVDVSNGFVSDTTHGSQPQKYILPEVWENVLKQFLKNLKEKMRLEVASFDKKDFSLRLTSQKIYSELELLKLQQELLLLEAKTGFSIRMLCFQSFAKETFKVVDPQKGYTTKTRTGPGNPMTSNKLFESDYVPVCEYSLEAEPQSCFRDFKILSEDFTRMSDPRAELLIV